MAQVTKMDTFVGHLTGEAGCKSLAGEPPCSVGFSPVIEEVPNQALIGFGD